MDRLYSKIIGLPVFIQDSIRPVSSVHDLVIDPTNGKIVAFLIDSRKKLVVSPMDIVSIKNGIFVRSSEDIIKSDEILRVDSIMREFGSLHDKKVFTENGKHIGKVVDFYVNPSSLVVGKIITAKSLLGIAQYDGRIIPASEIIEMKKDRVIVRDDVIAVREKEKSSVKERGAEMAFSG